MRLKNGIIGAAVVALLLAGGLATPATAGEADELTAKKPAASGETARDANVRLTLDALVGTQSPAEIQSILDSGEEVEALYDPSTQTYLAARLAEAPVVSPFAIGVTGPGCASTDACATNSYNNGYYGTGVLAINLYNVTKIYSGNRSTTWWQGATGTNMAPGVTLYFPFPGAHLTSISRS